MLQATEIARDQVQVAPPPRGQRLVAVQVGAGAHLCDLVARTLVSPGVCAQRAIRGHCGVEASPCRLAGGYHADGAQCGGAQDAHVHVGASALGAGVHHRQGAVAHLPHVGEQVHTHIVVVHGARGAQVRRVHHLTVGNAKDGRALGRCGLQVTQIPAFTLPKSGARVARQRAWLARVAALDVAPQVLRAGARGARGSLRQPRADAAVADVGSALRAGCAGVPRQLLALRQALAVHARQLAGEATSSHKGRVRILARVWVRIGARAAVHVGKLVRRTRRDNTAA